MTISRPSLQFGQASRSDEGRDHQALFDNLTVGIAYLTVRLELRRCNAKFEQMLGARPGALVGRSLASLATDPAALDDLAAVTGAAAAWTFRRECQMRRADGESFWCRLSGHPVDARDRQFGSVWVFEDVSQHRHSAESLHRLVEEQTRILDNVTVGICFQRGRVILRCNDRMGELFGYHPDELTGQPSAILCVNEASYRGHGSVVYDNPRTDRIYEGDDRYRRKDGSIFWCHVTGRAFDSGDGGLNWIWIFEDISARKQAERELLRAKAELEDRVKERTAELAAAYANMQEQYHFVSGLIDAIPSPFYYKDAAGRMLGCNSAFEEYSGVRREQLVGRTAAELAPHESIDTHLRADQEIIRTRERQVYETKVAFADGTRRDVVFYKAPVLRTDGELAALVGVMLDISERKKMEERLKQAATVFENTTEGVIIADHRRKIVAVNRAFSDITGYSTGEVVGRGMNLLNTGRHGEASYRAIWQEVGRTGRWQGEVCSRRKDGLEYPEWRNISAVRSGDGVVTHYVAVFSDITELKRSQERLDHQAHHDPLTDLPNRVLLEDRLAQALQRARREAAGLAVLFIDLDRFKNINDTLGHPIGDAVLQEVALRLGSSLRESDTVARLGGDEFIAVLEHVGEGHEVGRVAAKVLEDLRRPVAVAGKEFFVSASVGISCFPQDGEDTSTLIRNADVAMYRAKELGRNSYAFYAKEMTSRALERFTLENELRHAISRGQLSLAYQPQYAIDSGRIIAAEALLRWHHPQHGEIAPTRFIPLAEDTGLIVPIGEWVLETACAQMKRWLDEGLPLLQVAVNTSGVELRRDGFLAAVENALARTGLPARHLEIEVTEGFIMTQAEYGIDVLFALRKLGVKLAIDDFGTGYSSLSYLKRLPIERLKIDKSFVRGLPADNHDAAISRTVIALGRNMGLRVIAEGVETAAQRDFLRDAGCSEIQGYLIGRPMNVGEFEALIAGTSAPSRPDDEQPETFGGMRIRQSGPH